MQGLDVNKRSLSDRLLHTPFNAFFSQNILWRKLQDSARIQKHQLLHFSESNVFGTNTAEHGVAKTAEGVWDSTKDLGDSFQNSSCEQIYVLKNCAWTRCSLVKQKAISLASYPSGLWVLSKHDDTLVLRHSSPPLYNCTELKSTRKDRKAMLWLASLRCHISGIKRKGEPCTRTQNFPTSCRKKNWEANHDQIFLFFWIKHWYKCKNSYLYQSLFSKKQNRKNFLSSTMLSRWCHCLSLLTVDYEPHIHVLLRHFYHQKQKNAPDKIKGSHMLEVKARKRTSLISKTSGVWRYVERSTERIIRNKKVSSTEIQ